MKIKNIKVYTNGEWVTHELPFEEYLTKAKTYADTQDNATLSSAKSYTNTKATETLNSAKSYADTQDGVVLNSAKSYADTQDNATLSSAKSYTDQEISEISENFVSKNAPEFGSDTLKVVKYLSQVPSYTSGGTSAGDFYAWHTFEVPRDGKTYQWTIVERETGKVFILEAYYDVNATYDRVKDTVVKNEIDLLDIHRYENMDNPNGIASTEYRFQVKDVEYTNTLWFAEMAASFVFPNKSGTVATLDDVEDIKHDYHLEELNNSFDFDGQTNRARMLDLKEYVNDTSGQGVQVNAAGTFVKSKDGTNYTLTLPNKNGTIATTTDVTSGVTEAKTYTDKEIAKIEASGSFSGTITDEYATGSADNDYTYTSVVKMDPDASLPSTDSGLKVEYSGKRNGGSYGSDTSNTTIYSADGIVLKHDHDNWSYGKDYYDMTLEASSLEFKKKIKTFNGSQLYAFDSKYEVSKMQLSAPISGENAVSSKDDLSTVKFALPTDSEMKDGKMPYFETISPAGDIVNGNRDMQSYKLELPRSTGTLAIYPTVSYARGDYDAPAEVTINSQTPVSMYFKIGPENPYTGAKGHNYSKFTGFHMPDIGIFVSYEELLHAYSCYKNYMKFLSIGGTSAVNNGDSGILIQTIKNDALYLIQVHNIDKVFDEDKNQRFEIYFHCMQVGSRQGHIVSYNIGRVYAVQETLTEKITNNFNPGSGY